jgi:hypothetical protein
MIDLSYPGLKVSQKRCDAMGATKWHDNKDSSNTAVMTPRLAVTNTADDDQKDILALREVTAAATGGTF